MIIVEKYHVIHEYTPPQFSAKVEGFLSRGWELHGEVIILKNTNGDSEFFQVVIRKREE
jgi:hypothetical protein